jgi:hypothetical protein
MLEKYMNEFIERMIVEQMELKIRCKKLNDFFNLEIFSNLGKKRKDLLWEQQEHMGKYSKALAERIDLELCEQYYSQNMVG